MAVLVSALFGVAGAGVFLLAPLVFDRPPAGLVRARPYIGGALGFAALLLGVEWLAIH